MATADDINVTRDRIRKLLTNDKPSMRDISSALIQAMSQKRPYGEVLNEMKAGRIAKEKTLYDVLTSERSFESQERRFKLEEKQEQRLADRMLWEQTKNQRGDIAEAIKTYVVNDEDRAKVAAEVYSQMPQIDSAGADAFVSQTVVRLADEGRIKATKAEKPSERYKNVAGVGLVDIIGAN